MFTALQSIAMFGALVAMIAMVAQPMFYATNTSAESPTCVVITRTVYGNSRSPKEGDDESRFMNCVPREKEVVVRTSFKAARTEYFYHGVNTFTSDGTAAMLVVNSSTHRVSNAVLLRWFVKASDFVEEIRPARIVDLGTYEKLKAIHIAPPYSDMCVYSLRLSYGGGFSRECLPTKTGIAPIRFALIQEGAPSGVWDF